MSVKNIKDIKMQDIKAGKSARFQILTNVSENVNLIMRRFVIGPGGEIPKHINTIEHEQFILKGQAEIGIGSKIFYVKKNDVVSIPEGIPHWYKVTGNEAFEFLCIIPNRKDCITFVE